MWRNDLSPLSGSLYRGDTGACGPSSALNSFYRRCGHMVSSQAHRTTWSQRCNIISVKSESSESFTKLTKRSWWTSVWFYLMQSEHSKSMGSSRSTGTLLQLWVLAAFCLELFVSPKVHQREESSSQLNFSGINMVPRSHHIHCWDIRCAQHIVRYSCRKTVLKCLVKLNLMHHLYVLNAFSLIGVWTETEDLEIQIAWFPHLLKWQIWGLFIDFPS